MEIAILLMILLIVVAVAAIKLSDVGVTFPFTRKATLYTAAERRFLSMLDTAVGANYRIMCRVRLSDIVQVRANTPVKISRNALSQASSRQLDFVLCDKETMSPVVAIDLVNTDSDKPYKAQRDWFVSGTLDTVRIPHLRIKAKPNYKPQEIRDVIQAKLAPLKYQQPQTPLIKGTIKPGTAAPGRPAAA